MSTIALATPPTIARDEQRAAVEIAVYNFTRQGWRVMSQTDTNAQLVKGKKTSHGLHIFLSVITAGLWVPVWIIVALTTGEKSKFVTVDQYGRVTLT